MYEMSAFPDLYCEVGGKLLLTPDKSTVPDPITSIIWKHGKNKVAEWDNDFGGLDIYAAFKGRTTLDQTTGELRISGLMKTDSGVYSVEFNSKLLDITYKLSVISKCFYVCAHTCVCTYMCVCMCVCVCVCRVETTGYCSASSIFPNDSCFFHLFTEAVPKPKITSSCNTSQTSCTLTCEGDTTDAEPVTYSWKVGEGAWEVGVEQFNVFKSDTGQSNNGYKYICKLNNAVSGEVSEPVGEVFGSGEWTPISVLQSYVLICQ
jgi:hypothetical protein